MSTSNEETEAILAKFKPLEDRILGLVVSMPIWSYKTVEELFPNEHPKAIYRAMKKLENRGSIRFVGYSKRVKQYTTYDVSNLPVLPDTEGKKYSIKALFPYIPQTFSDGKHWDTAVLLDDLPILICQIFAVARLEGTELTEGYGDLLRRLTKLKRVTDNVSSWIDILIKHPIMSDHEVFKAIIQKESPTNQEINQFNVWLSKRLKELESKNDA